MILSKYKYYKIKYNTTKYKIINITSAITTGRTSVSRLLKESTPCKRADTTASRTTIKIRIYVNIKIYY